jgi:hypothetical protein
MHGNYVTDTGARGSSCVTGRPYGCDIAPHDCSYKTTTCLLVTNEFDLGRFDHCIGRFNHGRKTPAFNHS